MLMEIMLYLEPDQIRPNNNLRNNKLKILFPVIFSKIQDYYIITGGLLFDPVKISKTPIWFPN